MSLIWGNRMVYTTLRPYTNNTNYLVSTLGRRDNAIDFPTGPIWGPLRGPFFLIYDRAVI